MLVDLRQDANSLTAYIHHCAVGSKLPTHWVPVILNRSLLVQGGRGGFVPKCKATGCAHRENTNYFLNLLFVPLEIQTLHFSPAEMHSFGGRMIYLLLGLTGRTQFIFGSSNHSTPSVTSIPPPPNSRTTDRVRDWTSTQSVHVQWSRTLPIGFK